MKWDELVLFRWDVLLICSNSLKKHKMSSRLTVPELQQFWSEVCIQSSAEWMMIQEMDIIHLKTAIRLIHFNFGFYVTSHCVKITDNSLSVCRSIFLAVCLFSCHSSCLYLCISTSVCLSLCLCAFLNVSISVLSLYIFLDIYVFCLSYLCSFVLNWIKNKWTAPGSHSWIRKPTSFYKSPSKIESQLLQKLVCSSKTLAVEALLSKRRSASYWWGCDYLFMTIKSKLTTWTSNTSPNLLNETSNEPNKETIAPLPHTPKCCAETLFGRFSKCLNGVCVSSAPGVV